VRPARSRPPALRSVVVLAGRLPEPTHLAHELARSGADSSSGGDNVGMGSVLMLLHMATTTIPAQA